MKRSKEYIKPILHTMFFFFFIYVMVAIKAYGIIKDFNYAGGFLMAMGAALFFSALEALARMDYRKRLQKAVDQRKPPQYIAKVKTVFHSLFVVELVLILFTFVAIAKSLGLNDLPGNKTLLVVSVWILVIAVPVIGLCNHFMAGRQ